MIGELPYWEARWREGRIGFHEGRVNEDLLREWPALGAPEPAAVLVPLCGKAHDLAWLAARGHRVLGVEGSERAVADFFAEQRLAPERAPAGPGEAWTAGRLTILRCDWFALRREHLEALAPGGADAWWDRAALVALPPEARRAHAERLAALLNPGARGLLASFDYPQEEMEGPPFSVPEDEVRALFGPPAFEAPQRLAHREKPGGLRSDGRVLSRSADTVFRLRRT